MSKDADIVWIRKALHKLDPVEVRRLREALEMLNGKV